MFIEAHWDVRKRTEACGGVPRRTEAYRGTYSHTEVRRSIPNVQRRIERQTEEYKRQTGKAGGI